MSQPWSAPEGFCQWAWADIRSYISANFHGGNLPMVACCTDGFRPERSVLWKQVSGSSGSSAKSDP